MKRLAGSALCALAIACGGAPNPPPGATSPGSLAAFGMAGDPIGFLLESRDSLRLPDSTVQKLVRLNLRLYQRNANLQMSIDTTLRSAHFDPTSVRDSSDIPAPVRERIEPFIQLRREQTAAARDTAYMYLTQAQADSARVLFDRTAMRRRGGTPDAGRPPGRP